MWAPETPGAGGRRHGTVVRAVVLVGGVVLATVGCSKPAEPGAPAPVPVSFDALRAIPEDTDVWRAAIDAADEADRLPELEALTVELAEEHPERWQPAWATGEIRFRKKPRDSAREPFEHALAIARAGNDPIGIARAENRLAYLAFEALDYARAEDLYSDARDAATSAGDAELEADIASNVAGMRFVSGHFAEAAELLRHATEVYRRLDIADKLEAQSYLRGTVLLNLGRLAEAKDALEEAFRSSVSSGNERRAGNACIALGNLHRALREYAAARDWYAKIPATHGRLAHAELGQGQTCLDAGDVDCARKFLDLAAEQSDEPVVRGLATVYLAELERRTGDGRAALERASNLDPSVAESTKGIPALAATVRGKALRQLEGPAAAEKPLREAIALFEKQGEGLDAEQGLAYPRERAEPYAALAEALSSDPAARAGDVLDVVERAHARALRRMLAGSGGESTTVPLAALRAALPPGTVLLDYLVGEDRGALVAVTRDAARAFPLPGWDTLREPLARYRQALMRPLVSAEARLDPAADLARDLDRGRGLRRTLIDPAAALLADATRVLVVPDQDLALVPFAAFPEDGERPGGGPAFLGDRLELAVLPMAGVPDAWRAGDGPVLLAGDPLPDPDGRFPVLALAGDELDGLDRVWSGDPTTDLRREHLTADALHALDLGRFRTLHFATHAVASSLDPRRCAVMLSHGEPLALQDVAALHLGPALVVLSACRTGEGEVVPGEGVVGLTWAFLRAGARGVTASLWSVEDASTAEWMTEFHRRLRAGDDPVRAAAVAQRAVAAERPHPAYWAPFVVVLHPQGG